MARQPKEQLDDGSIAESNDHQIPRYRIDVDSLIDVHFVEAGTEIDSTATPGSFWVPLNAAAEKAVEEFKAKEEARQKQNSRASLQQALAESILESPS